MSGLEIKFQQYNKIKRKKEKKRKRKEKRRKRIIYDGI